MYVIVNCDYVVCVTWNIYIYAQEKIYSVNNVINVPKTLSNMNQNINYKHVLSVKRKLSVRLSASIPMIQKV